MSQNTPILVVIGNNKAEEQLELLFGHWPSSVSAPIICCAFSERTTIDANSHGQIPHGYQVEFIGADLTHELKNYRIYFAPSLFRLTRQNILWSYEAVLSPEASTVESIIEHYDAESEDEGLVIGVGLGKVNCHPNKAILLLPKTEDEFAIACKTVEVFSGTRAPLLRRLLVQANYNVAQQTGIHIDNFRLTWLVEHDFFKDLSSEQIVEQYSSTEDAAAVIDRLLAQNRNHILPPDIISIVAQKIELLLLQKTNEPVKIWLAGGSADNLVRLLGILSESESLPLLVKNLKIQLTATTQNQVQQLKETTKQLQQQAGGSHLSAIQSLWRNCVFHSRHNVLFDPPYRGMDIIIAPWIFAPLKPIVANALAASFAVSQNEHGELIIAEGEPNIVHLEGYSGLDGSAFLRRRPKLKRSELSGRLLPPPPNLDDELGSSLQLRLGEHNLVLTSKGNHELFCHDQSVRAGGIIDQPVLEVIRKDITDGIEDLLSHVTGHVPRKKMIISNDQIFLCTIHNQIFDQRKCKFLTLEIIEDVDLEVPLNSFQESKTLTEHVHVMGQEKSRAFSSLERLSIQLATDNDRLQSELEPVKQELDHLRNERQILQDTLAETRKRQGFFASITNQSETPFAVCDHSGAIVYRNDKFLEAFSVTETEHLTDRKLGLPIDKVITLLEQCLKSGLPHTVEFRDITSGSSSKLLAKKIDESSHQILVQIISPEQGEHNSLELMKSLQQIKIGAVILDEKLNIEYIDKRVADWHQSEVTDLLHDPFSRLIHPEHRIKYEDSIKDVASKPLDLEVPLLRKDGDTTWVRIRSLSEESPKQTILLIENILLRKQGEKQNKITQKLELLGQITGGVAHDFNNILAIIIGYIDLMSSGLDELNAHDAGRYLVQMKDASERARNLVRQLLLYSRGDKSSTVTKQNIAKGIEDTLPLIRTSLQEHIYLATNISNENTFIEMDPAHLHQILMNLCINARDAVDEVEDRDGEIIIGVKMAEAEEDIDCVSCQTKIQREDQGNYVILSVTDNGPGMAPETIEHMFDPFFTTKSANKGSGMGLSVVHGLVHQYGGHLQVLNSNYGVQFRIWLPTAAPADSPSNVQPMQPKPKASFNWRVLIVEDDNEVADVLSKLLAYLQIDAVHSQNGMEALKRLENDQDFKLVITDHSMPVMNGSELAEACYKMLPELPVVLLSGNSLEIKTDSLPPNVLHVMDKPVTTQELTDTIRLVADRVDRAPTGEDLSRGSTIH